MAHDGQSMIDNQPLILSDLLGLSATALEKLEGLFETATQTLRAKVEVEGRVSGAKIEQEQTAAHGLAWLATYVESLRQMQKWAETLSNDGKFGETEQLIHQIAFGEYLWQIYGGIPMSQGEILRLQDIGLTQEEMSGLMDPAVMSLTMNGNT